MSTGTSSEQKHWNKERNWNFAVINVIKEQNLKRVTPLFPTYTSLECFHLESAMKVKSQKAIASACIMLLILRKMLSSQFPIFVHKLRGKYNTIVLILKLCCFFYWRYACLL